MSIHRTLSDAQRNCHNSASWKQSTIWRHTLNDGRTYFSVQTFDTYDHVRKCKRCRKARIRLNGVNLHKHNLELSRGIKEPDSAFGESAATGHTCDRCCNPFAAKVRIYRYACLNGGWIH